MFCVFPIRPHHTLLIPPPHSVKTPTPGDPGFGNSTDSRRHIPLSLAHASFFSRKISHSSCSESRKFSFNSPLLSFSPPTWCRELRSWKVQSKPGLSCLPSLRKALICTLACHCAASPQARRRGGGGSRAELASRAPVPAPAPTASPARALSPGRSLAAPSRPQRAARAAPSAVPPPSAAVPTPSRKRVLVTPSSEPVTCSAPPRTRAVVRLTHAASSGGRTWPGPSGEELCAPVGGLRGGGSPGKIWGLGQGRKRVWVGVTVGAGCLSSESVLVNPLRTEAG